MNNPGVYNLGNKVLTVALDDEVITDVGGVGYISDLSGMLGANIQIRFNFGSGSTSGKIFIQTSLDQGDTWIDVICMTFTDSSVTKVWNFSGLTPKSAYATTDGSLSDDSCIDGILGDRWRAKVTTEGTYATNTSLSVRLTAR